LHDSVRQQITKMRTAFRRDDARENLERFYETMPPFFHQAWVSSMLEPVVPAMHNTDGDPVVITRVSYEALDQAALRAALDGAEGFERTDDGTWTWSGMNAKGNPVVLGTLRLEDVGARLVVETNSVARGARGREIVEAAARQALRYRAT